MTGAFFGTRCSCDFSRLPRNPVLAVPKMDVAEMYYADWHNMITA